VDPALESATDGAIQDYYNGRETDCSFLQDPTHYEYPRGAWLIERVRGPVVLEVGCGNGGFTRVLSQRVERVVALDVSAPSLAALRAFALPNVETEHALLETYRPARRFDCIVMSDVLEHLRDPRAMVRRCVELLAPGGVLLLTTPNGHWECGEHFHEFKLEQVSDMLAASGAERIATGFLRDRENRRRWLVGEAWSGKDAPAPDDFHSGWAVVQHRIDARKHAPRPG